MHDISHRLSLLVLSESKEKAEKSNYMGFVHYQTPLHMSIT